MRRTTYSVRLLRLSMGFGKWDGIAKLPKGLIVLEFGKGYLKV